MQYQQQSTAQAHCKMLRRIRSSERGLNEQTRTRSQSGVKVGSRPSPLLTNTSSPRLKRHVKTQSLVAISGPAPHVSSKIIPWTSGPGYVPALSFHDPSEKTSLSLVQGQHYVWVVVVRGRRSCRGKYGDGSMLWLPRRLEDIDELGIFIEFSCYDLAVGLLHDRIACV